MKNIDQHTITDAVENASWLETKGKLEKTRAAYIVGALQSNPPYPPLAAVVNARKRAAPSRAGPKPAQRAGSYGCLARASDQAPSPP